MHGAAQKTLNADRWRNATSRHSCDEIISSAALEPLYDKLVVPEANKALGEIADALHAGRCHAGPGGVERAGQVDRPAAGLDEHGSKTEPARVHG
jgi:hypothetical protein